MAESGTVAAADPGRMRWLRRYVWGSLAFVGLVTAPVLASDLFTAGFGTADRVVLLVLLVAAVVQRLRFLGYAARAVELARRRRVEQILTTTVAILAWAHAARYTPNPALWSLLPALVGGAGVVSAPHGQRGRLTVGLVSATAVTGALALSWRRVPEVSVPETVAVAAVIVAALAFADLLSARFWDIVLELDRARALEGELAATRERLRFAADLHDIQGHSLQAIALKGELTERLIGTDDAAARGHAAELTRLARSALTDTRELAKGYREIDLHTEIDNAVELMRAAGIEVTVHGDPARIAPPLQRAFGALVREGTTNVLRHSRARRCELDVHVDDDGVTVRLGNDGVGHVAVPADTAGTPDTPDTAGSGVRGLRERFATIGGEVTAGRTGDDRYELTGRAREVW
ncbi:sensor histidine kinase [Saccharomonospora iraqiensis]|uniref:sensor histidine kinase n=1 Tax=Saccharomonospora iraqiensis TaxID=52698 RepID=UPI00047EDF41|nr:histidine kinase [Saccharomonospora iraqiensis]